jgi:hypothetical protein
MSRGVWAWIGLMVIACGAAMALRPDVPVNRPAAPQQVRFTDITARSGIRFRHDGAHTAEKYLVETMGSGCAFLDFDQDGFLDVLLVNGGPTAAYRPQAPVRNALYRSNGDGTFTDVTERAGIRPNWQYAMGVTVADYDNDGYPDIYLSGFHMSALYHNNRNGTFTEVARKAGVENRARWETSAAWFDYDNDGFLDLFVANYLDYDYGRNAYCGESKPGFRMYCHPQNYPGAAPTLYHNNRDGTFTDVTHAAGLDQFKAKGLGVVAADLDNDGWVDLFIANDSIRNLLYRNRRDGTFEDVTLPSGTGYGEDGQPEAGMGVDAGDYNGDGLLDLFVTHLDFELNRLYENRGAMAFADATMSSRLARSAVLYSGFGTRFFDYDNDGWKDLLVVNGHVLDNVSLYRPDVRYAERKLLFHNEGGSFRSVGDSSGEPFRIERVGRGLALGDFDNDGDLDVLVSNNHQGPELLRNEGGNANHWLAIRLVGVKSNRDGIGARVRVVAGSSTQIDQAKGGGSYLSASDPRLYFGLGSRVDADLVEVKWPSGAVDSLRAVRANRFVTIREGQGEVPSRYPAFR